jgi:hypothetical protein
LYADDTPLKSGNSIITHQKEVLQSYIIDCDRNISFQREEAPTFDLKEDEIEISPSSEGNLIHESLKLETAKPEPESMFKIEPQFAEEKINDRDNILRPKPEKKESPKHIKFKPRKEISVIAEVSEKSLLSSIETFDRRSRSETTQDIQSMQQQFTKMSTFE